MMGARVFLLALVAMLSADIATPASTTTTRTPAIVNWNTVADFLISTATQDILREGKDTVPLPDVQKEFSQDVFGNEIYGQLLFKDGKLKNISSFRRIEDIKILEQDVQKVKLLCLFSLDEFVASFENFEVKFLGLRIGGFIQATVDSNIFNMTILGTDSSEGCSVSILGVQLVKLGKFTARVDGVGIFNDLASSLFTSYLDQTKGSLIETLESTLLTKLANTLGEYDCTDTTALLSSWAR